MPNALVKKVDIQGTGDTDKLLKLDISTYENGGNIGYHNVEPAPNKAIDDDVVVHGIKGVVNKTGTMASRSGVGSLVSAELGNKAVKEFVNIIKPEDNINFKPYYLSDIVSFIHAPGLSVELRGYDLMIESYVFSGYAKNCLEDIAGLIYGSVVYDSIRDKYVIVGGDTTYSSRGSGNPFVIKMIEVISWELVVEKNTKLSAFATAMVAAAKELAKLRAAIIDLNDALAQKLIDDAKTKTSTQVSNVTFDFGWKGGVQEIPSYCKVDSTQWDEWYIDAKNNKFIGPTGDKEFSMKQTKYFKTETLKPIVTVLSPNGGPTTKERGKMRGLRTIHMATIWHKIFNVEFGTTVKGKGYVSNLDCMGIPSLTKYETDKLEKLGEDKVDVDDTYRVLYEFKTYEKKIRKSEYATTYEIIYERYLGFHLNIQVYNAVFDAIKAQKMKEGNNEIPSEGEMIEGLLKLHYVVKVDIMAEETSLVNNSFVYKGYLDKYNRLISDSGQVLAVLVDNFFYGALPGMDMSFTMLTANQTQDRNAAYTLSLADSQLLSGFFDENDIRLKLEAALKDLIQLCKAQPPIGTYSINNFTVTGRTYPSFIAGVYVDSKTNQQIISTEIVGCVFGIKEPTVPLTVAAYTSSTKQKKILIRKIKCLEDKLRLIIACIKKNDPSNSISLATIKDILKVIITYETVLNKVKDESLPTMVAMRQTYEDALNACYAKFNGTTNAKVHRATLSVTMPDILPTTGDSLQLPHEIGTGNYKVTSVAVSGVTASVIGEYNV
jgi:hypothetical protein